MQSSPFRLSSWQARVATAFLALFCSVASLGAVVAMYASASGELDPALARLKAEPPASQAARKLAATQAPS